jgi:hypothetical protein
MPDSRSAAASASTRRRMPVTAVGATSRVPFRRPRPVAQAGSVRAGSVSSTGPRPSAGMKPVSTHSPRHFLPFAAEGGSHVGLRFRWTAVRASATLASLGAETSAMRASSAAATVGATATDVISSGAMVSRARRQRPRCAPLASASTASAAAASATHHRTRSGPVREVPAPSSVTLAGMTVMATRRTAAKPTSARTTTTVVHAGTAVRRRIVAMRPNPGSGPVWRAAASA